MKFTISYIIGSLTCLVLTGQQRPSGSVITDDPQFSEALVAYDCALTLDDPSGGIREFRSFPLFSHTPVKARPLLGNKSLMDVKAHIYKAGDQVFLILDIRIHAAQARQTYGELPKASGLKVSLSDGEYVYLENIERDKGKVDRVNSFTDYQGVYLLPKASLKKLQKEYIYKIGLVWEEGFEEYEVMNIDLIKNQLQCLK